MSSDCNNTETMALRTGQVSSLIGTAWNDSVRRLLLQCKSITALEPQGKHMVWTASLLFLASGAAGLAYEVIWFKRFSHVWGNSTLAMASVISSFLFGLGLGAYFFGRFADYVKRPLFWYGVFEAGIGVLALLIPHEIRVPMSLASAVLPEWQPGWLQFGLRFFVTLCILGPPCALMGGTLPLLVRQFTVLDVRMQRWTGWFYAVNTLGAAAGCFLTGFLLLPSLGLFWTNIATASLNLLVAAIAMIVGWGLIVSTGPAIEDRTNLHREADVDRCGEAILPSRATVCFVTAVTGCAALMLQMVWNRQLALILGSSTYAFSAVLFLVLVGIGLGSLLFQRWLSRSAWLPSAPAWIILALILSTLLGTWLIPEATYIVGVLRNLRGSEVTNAFVCIAAAAAIELLPTVCMGLLFPLCVELIRYRPSQTGRVLGGVYFWNTAGAIVGTIITPLVLVPALGTAKTLGTAAAMYLACLIILLPARNWREVSKLVGASLLGACAVLLIMRPIDPRITNIGMFLYGYTPPQELATENVLQFEEGASCTVMVTANPTERSLRVNGKVDASSMGDMSMQLGLAYLPRFFVPDAREVFVIGFGSGSTCGASLLFPDTHVTCCEIEPAVFRASRHFADVNHNPERSDRFSIVFDDGRSYLQRTKKRYDLILSEPSNPWIAGVSNLFTEEFYEAARDRLEPAGVFAHSFDVSDYSMIVRTVKGVFPYCSLVRISQGDTLLLAGMSPLAVAKRTADIAQRLVDETPAIATDLKRYFGSSDVRSLIVSHLVLGDEATSRLARLDGSEHINTDQNLRLEFDAPRRLYRSSGSDVGQQILSVFDASFSESLVRAYECSRDQLAGLKRLSEIFSEEQQELVRPVVELALRLDPDDAFFLGQQPALAAQDGEDISSDQAVRISSWSATVANGLGVRLWRAKKYESAVRVFESILATQPNSATSWANLAINYAELGQQDQATRAFEQAIALDPFNDFATNSYKEFQERATAQQRLATIGN